MFTMRGYSGFLLCFSIYNSNNVRRLGAKGWPSMLGIEGRLLVPKWRTLFELYMEKHKRKPEYPLVVNIYATGITVGEPNAIM